MLTGDEIRRARQRAGWSQEELARRVGSTLRSIGNWERGTTSPTRKELALYSALSGYLDADIEGGPESLHKVSDVDLLGEIARRLARSQRASSTRKQVTHDDSETPITHLHDHRRPGHDPAHDQGGVAALEGSDLESPGEDHQDSP